MAKKMTSQSASREEAAVEMGAQPLRSLNLDELCTIIGRLVLEREQFRINGMERERALVRMIPVQATRKARKKSVDAGSPASARPGPEPQSIQ